MPNKEPAKVDVLQGTLDLMVLQTTAALGPLHGYAIAARHGLRSMRRTPLFAIVVLLTLTIGIGANTAVFSVVNALKAE